MSSWWTAKAEAQEFAEQLGLPMALVSLPRDGVLLPGVFVIEAVYALMVNHDDIALIVEPA